MGSITTPQKTCYYQADRGGQYICHDVAPTVTVTQADRGGGQIKTVANPDYVPAGLFLPSGSEKTLGNIDPAITADRSTFDKLAKENAPVFIEPIKYQADRGGSQIGGKRYYKDAQSEANDRELYQIGVARGYIDPNSGDLHGLSKIVGDVIQGVVIGGIAWGGGLAIGQATGGAVGASTATIQGAAANPSGILGNVATGAGTNLVGQGVSAVLSPGKPDRPVFSGPQSAPRSNAPVFGLNGGNGVATPQDFYAVDNSQEQYRGVNPLSNWYVIGAILFGLIVLLKARG